MREKEPNLFFAILPTVEETLEFIRFNNLNSKDKKIILTHFNHTNSCLQMRN